MWGGVVCCDGVVWGVVGVVGVVGMVGVVGFSFASSMVSIGSLWLSCLEDTSMDDWILSSNISGEP